jgi:hypothetical protein
VPILGHSILMLYHKEDLLEWVRPTANRFTRAFAALCLVRLTHVTGGVQLWGATMVADYKSWQFKIIGQPPFVAILDPENVKHVLQTNFDNYVKVRAPRACRSLALALSLSLTHTRTHSLSVCVEGLFAKPAASLLRRPQPRPAAMPLSTSATPVRTPSLPLSLSLSLPHSLSHTLTLSHTLLL